MPTLHTILDLAWRIIVIWLALDIVFLDVMWRLADRRDEE